MARNIDKVLESGAVDPLLGSLDIGTNRAERVILRLIAPVLSAIFLGVSFTAAILMNYVIPPAILWGMVAIAVAFSVASALGPRKQSASVWFSPIAFSALYLLAYYLKPLLAGLPADAANATTGAIGAAALVGVGLICTVLVMLRRTSTMDAALLAIFAPVLAPIAVLTAVNYGVIVEVAAIAAFFLPFIYLLIFRGYFFSAWIAIFVMIGWLVGPVVASAFMQSAGPAMEVPATAEASGSAPVTMPARADTLFGIPLMAMLLLEIAAALSLVTFALCRRVLSKSAAGESRTRAWFDLGNIWAMTTAITALLLAALALTLHWTPDQIKLVIKIAIVAVTGAFLAFAALYHMSAGGKWPATIYVVYAAASAGVMALVGSFYADTPDASVDGFTDTALWIQSIAFLLFALASLALLSMKRAPAFAKFGMTIAACSLMAVVAGSVAGPASRAYDTELSRVNNAFEDRRLKESDAAFIRLVDEAVAGRSPQESASFLPTPTPEAYAGDAYAYAQARAAYYLSFEEQESLHNAARDESARALEAERDAELVKLPKPLSPSGPGGKVPMAAWIALIGLVLTLLAQRIAHTNEGPGAWRGFFSARQAVFLRRTGRAGPALLKAIPFGGLFTAAGDAIISVLRHLRGANALSFFGEALMLAAIGYLALLIIAAPPLKFLVEAVTANGGDTTGPGLIGVRLIEFGVLSYVIGRVSQMRLLTYVGLAAIAGTASVTFMTSPPNPLYAMLAAGGLMTCELIRLAQAPIAKAIGQAQKSRAAATAG